MQFRMDKTIRELVEEAWAWNRLGRDDDFLHRDEVFASTLMMLESEGDVLRRLDSEGRIAWEATPQLKSYLLDLKRDAELDFENEDM